METQGKLSEGGEDAKAALIPRWLKLLRQTETDKRLVARLSDPEWLEQVTLENLQTLVADAERYLQSSLNLVRAFGRQGRRSTDLPGEERSPNHR